MPKAITRVLLLTVLVLSSAGMSRAQAVDPGTVVSIVVTAARTAYEAYQKYSGNVLSLEGLMKSSTTTEIYPRTPKSLYGKRFALI